MGSKKQVSNQKEEPTLKAADPLGVAKEFLNLGEQIQKSMQSYTTPENLLKSNTQPFANPFRVAEAFTLAAKRLSEDPSPAFKATEHYITGYADLWEKTLKNLSGQGVEGNENLETAPSDRRFRDPTWDKYATFNFLKQSYLLWDHWVKEVSNNIQGLDPTTSHKVAFYARQITDAFSPGNYLWSNPRAIKRMIETGGLSLMKGLENFLKDIEKGGGELSISMVEREAFQVGKNISVTPGKVVYQNDLIQLIQYSPTTKNVFRTPLLLIPPCINKFYIYDLREDNSFVRWILDRGHTVFMVSWVNPDEKLSHKTFEDYVIEGLNAAIKVIQEITREDKVNAVGFCIGGNFLAALEGYYANRGENKNPLMSTTYLATLFDFEKAGDLKIFIDEERLEELETQMRKKGYFDGRILAQTFNLLRANDLIWSFVINNYLMGEDPMAFDLLYWNSDSTNLPATMYGYYLRNMFLNNNLVKPGGIKIKDVKVDLRNVKTPSFILNTRDDHIAPWPCGFAGKQVFSGPTKFVLGGSGHIAGIFNSPKANKYCYWTGDKPAKTAEDWFTKATEHAGSWWKEWSTWLEPFGQEKVPGRKPGSKKHPPLEDAPGSYVLQ